MPVDDLQPVEGMPILPFILFLALTAAAVAWVVGMLLYWRRNHRQTFKLMQVTTTLRDRWIARLRATVAKHSGSDEDARMLHLALASDLRDILSERAGRDVTSWTAAELRMVPELTGVANLIQSWEAPSFAPYSQADARTAEARAVEVVSQW